MILERTKKLAFKARWTVQSLRQSQDRQHYKRIYHQRSGIRDDRFDSVFVYDGPAIIEPKYGYIVSRGGYLIEDSLVPNLGEPLQPWRHSMPDPSDFKSVVRRENGRVQHYPVVISLRHLWEWNYFHFYNDVLSRIQLFDSIGIDPSTPLALGNYADDVPFVKQIIKIGGLADRNWILPGHNYISADKIYYARIQRTWREKFAPTVAMMRLPTPDAKSEQRIFVTRPLTATRRILNLDEIEPVLKKHGFETVDTSGLPVAEQIKLFSQTRHLIAIHGAGIVNVIYRDGAPLSLLELRPDVYWTDDMQEICEQYGYQSTTLTGRSEGESAQHANFRINPNELEQKIIELTGTQP